jgi:hypothetical protein
MALMPSSQKGSCKVNRGPNRKNVPTVQVFRGKYSNCSSPFSYFCSIIDVSVFRGGDVPSWQIASISSLGKTSKLFEKAVVCLSKRLELPWVIPIAKYVKLKTENAR